MNLLLKIRNARQIVTYAPKVTSRQVSRSMDLSEILNAAGRMKGVDSLNDTDGAQIFVLGITPITADVRMGRLNT